MKKITFLLFVLLSATYAKSQSGIVNSFGYRKTGELDTVPVVILITECNDCPSRSMSAFAVREESKYFGDTMGQTFRPYWAIKNYLTADKKRSLPKNIHVWGNDITE